MGDFCDKKSRFSLFYRFGVLGNPQKEPLNAKYTKNLHFWAFWTTFGSKICKNLKKWAFFSKNGVFLTFFAIFATFLGWVFHRKYIGTIFRPFWVKNWAKIRQKIDKNQHFSTKMGGFLDCFVYFATLLGGVCHKGHTVRFLWKNGNKILEKL